MINKLLAGTAMVFAPAAAMAADLPVRAPAPAPIFMAAAPTWAGFYIGANFGITVSNSKNEMCSDYSTDGLCEGGYDGGRYSTNSMGALAGLTAGYNMQSGNFVYGLEGDFGGVFGGLSKHNEYNVWFYGQSQTQAIGTIRARAGITNGNSLFYLTAGAAAVNTKMRASNMDYDDKISTKSSWKFAPVFGAGIEHQLGGGWSAKVEGLYIAGVKNKVFSNTDSSEQKGFSQKQDIGIVRFGVNYRFGASSTGPVLARY